MIKAIKKGMAFVQVRVIVVILKMLTDVKKHTKGAQLLIIKKLKCLLGDCCFTRAIKSISLCNRMSVNNNGVFTDGHLINQCRCGANIASIINATIHSCKFLVVPIALINIDTLQLVSMAILLSTLHIDQTLKWF